MDYSKASDNVSHNILFSKLHESGGPAILLRFIWFWYLNQNIVIKYEGCLSSSWKLLSGVRQRGILSPLLFDIHINSMINDISCSKYGCRLGFFKSNILAYANDIVILSPYLFGRQKLLDLCIDKSNKLKLTFNANKSFAMKFSWNKSKSSMESFKVYLGNNE